jgi:hypothetical protein
MTGLAFFRGAIAPSLDGLQGLKAAGIEVEPADVHNGEIWAASLRHPTWGRARLSAPRKFDFPLADLVKFASGLTDSERSTIEHDAQSLLMLEVSSQTDDVLRDRKDFLRFMAAVLGSDGVTGIDLLAQTFWTPGRLADELNHSAPLDIIHIHVLHVVTQPGGVWLHSHGLAEIGFVDFDVLRPAEDLTGNQFDLLRSIAFHIVEGASSGSIEPAVGADPVALIDAQTFMRSAAISDTVLRDPADHSDRRVVCCDTGSAGFIGRLFGAKDLRPSRLLSRGLTEGKHLIRFSDSATELTATRARESMSLVEPLRQEFADLKCTALVKLGYATDSGRSGREHLWFELHSVANDQLDATLVNDPFDIASMKAGDRRHHPVDLVTDWAIMTPLGQLTPRSLELARKLRELRPKILEFLRKQS